MIRRVLFPLGILLLAYGFWVSTHFGQIAAGVAIFLFGMLALEEGFRALAGGMLDIVLRRSTGGLWRSLSFGMISTALVQSSSLISLLTISFLSAGLITLASGLGIVFGANLGTTTGAWLIAGFGLKISLSAYAMPLLVFGVLLVMQKKNPAKGIGYVLLGAGFIFLGIEYMKQGFESFRSGLDLARFAMPGFTGLTVFTMIGVLATVIMQSSHAVLLLILTALSAGQVTYENALALAIGSNIGTTVTAIIGSIGATAEGRRLAAAHFLFNMVTALLAIVFIAQFVRAVELISAGLGVAKTDYTLKLAIFHSLFNIIGVIVMLPFVGFLERRLSLMFVPRAVPFKQPRYLKPASIGYPDAAIEAVRMEIVRLYDVAVKIITHGLGLSRTRLFSDEDVGEVIAASRSRIREDINEKYSLNVKALYSAIVEYTSQAQMATDETQAERLHQLRLAGSAIVEATKAVKHLQKNLIVYMNSSNQWIRAEYDGIRRLVGEVLRFIEAARAAGNEDVTILSYDEVRLQLAKADIVSNGALDRLIRGGKITSQMATSLMNDYSYANNACEKLIFAAKILFSKTESSMRRAESDIALADEEVKELADRGAEAKSAAID